MIKEFKRGDKVYHKIELMPMIVLVPPSVTNDNQVECRLLDGDGNYIVMGFYPEELTSGGGIG